VDKTVLGEINRIRQMSVGELQAEWLRLNGEPTRSRNKQFLWRRLAWRIQELRHGGLSDAAKAKIDQLAPDIPTRERTPREAIDDARAASVQPVASSDPKPRRDPRLPTPGTVIVKNYKGRELRLVVHEDHFELDGRSYRSLSEAARAVTGSRWNGRLFWGLTERRRKS
jgi:hypothetical protein